MIWGLILLLVFLYIVALVAQIGGSYAHALLGIAVIAAILNFVYGKRRRVRA